MLYTYLLYIVDVDPTIDSSIYKLYIELPAFFLTAVFLIDLIANLAVQGLGRIWKERKVLILEIFI